METSTRDSMETSTEQLIIIQELVRREMKPVLDKIDYIEQRVENLSRLMTDEFMSHISKIQEVEFQVERIKSVLNQTRDVINNGIY